MGSVEEPRLQNLLELLTALSGHEPAPINIHEMTLRCEDGKIGQEIQLRHLIIPGTSNGTITTTTPGADRWAVYQYNRPPWGDLNMAKLAATVRTVTQAYCSGPNVPNFYKGLGFLQRYQHFKKGFAFDVQRGTWAVHILVSKLHRVVQELGAQGGARSFRGEDERQSVVEAGEEVAPGHVLIEVWTEVDAGKTHTEAIAVIVEVGKQLAGEGVVLQPLPDENYRPPPLGTMPMQR